MTGIVSAMAALAKFDIEQDDKSGKWFVVDVAHAPHRYRQPVPYGSRDEAEASMDLLNAVWEGQPANVLADLRSDLDRLSTGRYKRL